METVNILGENIKAYRKQLKLTGEDLARMTGISRQSLQMHESGKRMPTSENIKRYAQVFGVTAFVLERNPHPDTWRFTVFNEFLWLVNKS